MNATGEYLTGNCTVEATYHICSDETTVHLTTDQPATLILDSFIIPELSPLFILPFFLAGSLLIALAYRRRRA